MDVTRLEIAECLETTFGEGPRRRGELITAAELGGARQEVLSTLDRLPEGPFSTLRSLWGHLPEVPRSA
ncbi:hypothetical protein F4561_005682 [Lipingzhangella halophila]|uniref:DUF2795 domain-containing protein n=1 Tax=Lipingzhangella halophila TaxID=1783352 RepID=A0A7W7RML9_9ACTN|nr:DUF2795 domain-containing protein [Lipingzhangella halophila]MBB4934788.1 hypothetical protein [Lipingzhangella halophila]